MPVITGLPSLVRYRRAVPQRLGPIARHSSKDLSRSRVRTTLTAVLAVVLFLASFAGFAYRDLQSQVSRVNVSALVGTDRPTRENIPDNYAGVAVNILVLGSDRRDGANNVDGSDGTADVAGARSDTAMILHISADRSRMEVVSIPRDTLVDIPSCTRQDGTQAYAQSDTMFNQAFANGAGEGTDPQDVAAGAACTIRTVEAMTGIHIDDFVVVDFAGLQGMVDALGGVTLYNDEDIDDTAHTGWVLPAGCHVLAGFDALQYARVRYGAGDGSDISRITRQQNLMSAMLRTAQNKNLLTSADELYGFARAALGTLTTSERIGSLTNLAGLAQSVSSIGLDKVSFITMPNGPAPWDENRVIATSEADAVWEALRTDVPVPSSSVTTQGDGTVVEDSADAGSSTDGAAGAGTGADAGSASGEASSSDQGAAPTPSPTQLDPRAQCYANAS